MNTSDQPFKTVDEYIAKFPTDVQAILRKIRLTIRKAAPKASELISYGMPFYEYGGKGIKGRLIYFSAFKKHISLFITPRDTETITRRMKRFHVSKATYQFPLNEPFPYDILEEVVKALVKTRDSKVSKIVNTKIAASNGGKDIDAYGKQMSTSDRAISKLLKETIDKHLTKGEGKIWHGHPVWFLDGNPIVGYSRQKAGIRLMFWSGASFEDAALKPGTGKFKDASVFYNDIKEVNTKDLKRWLKKSEEIQWDYKNIVKRKGKLERVK